MTNPSRESVIASAVEAGASGSSVADALGAGAAPVEVDAGAVPVDASPLSLGTEQPAKATLAITADTKATVTRERRGVMRPLSQGALGRA